MLPLDLPAEYPTKDAFYHYTAQQVVDFLKTTSFKFSKGDLVRVLQRDIDGACISSTMDGHHEDLAKIIGLSPTAAVYLGRLFRDMDGTIRNEQDLPNPKKCKHFRFTAHL